MSRFFSGLGAAAKKSRLVAPATDAAETRRKAFFEFCEADDADMVLAHLLEAPELLHAKDGDDNMSALEIAAGFNATKTIRVLVDNGHELNVRDDAGRTALAYACAWNSADAVATLLSLDADVNAADFDGNTVLMECCKFKALECLQLLLAHASTDVQLCPEGVSALHVAAKAGFTAGVDALLAAGARIQFDFEGRSALAYASDAHAAGKQVRVKKAAQKQHDAQQRELLDIIVVLARHANYHIKSLCSVDGVEIHDRLVLEFGVSAIVRALRADPDVAAEHDEHFNSILQSCCRVLRRGKPAPLPLDDLETIFSLLIADAAHNTIQMFAASILRFVAPTLDTLRLVGSYMQKAARIVLAAHEPNAGYAIDFLQFFFEPFVKLLLKARSVPAVRATMPYFAHAFDAVWHALVNVAMVDMDDMIEDGVRFAVLIRTFYFWAQLFPQLNFLEQLQQWSAPPAASSSSASAAEASADSAAASTLNAAGASLAELRTPRVHAHFFPRAPPSDELFSHAPTAAAAHISVVASLHRWSTLVGYDEASAEADPAAAPRPGAEADAGAAANKAHAAVVSASAAASEPGDNAPAAAAAAATAATGASSSSSSSSSAPPTQHRKQHRHPRADAANADSKSEACAISSLPADLVAAAAAPIYAIPANIKALRDVDHRTPISSCFTFFLENCRAQLMSLIRSSSTMLREMPFLFRIPGVLDVKAKAAFVRSAIYGADNDDEDEDDEEEDGQEEDEPEHAGGDEDGFHDEKEESDEKQGGSERPGAAHSHRGHSAHHFHGDHSDHSGHSDGADSYAESSDVLLTVKRVGMQPSDMFAQWRDCILAQDAKTLHRDLIIEFEDEAGVGNGPFRELFAMLSQALFCEQSPVFAPTPNGTEWHLRLHARPDVSADQMPSMYEAAGRTVAMAITRELPMNCRLSLPLLKRCIGQKTTWHDIKHVDQSLFLSLSGLVSKRNTPDFWSALDQHFVATVIDANGVAADVALCPGGEIMLVDEKNKTKYADLLVNLRLFSSSQTIALGHFLRGFEAVMPARHARMLKPEELQLLISGNMRLDVDDLRKNLIVTGVNSDHPCVAWLLDEIAAMTTDEHALLLQFWSGSQSVPVNGFAPASSVDFSWTVNVMSDMSSEMLPSAATCSYLLKLPLYATRDALASKLRIAIRMGSAGFDNH